MSISWQKRVPLLLPEGIGQMFRGHSLPPLSPCILYGCSPSYFHLESGIYFSICFKLSFGFNHRKMPIHSLSCLHQNPISRYGNASEESSVQRVKFHLSNRQTTPIYFSWSNTCVSKVEFSTLFLSSWLIWTKISSGKESGIKLTMLFVSKFMLEYFLTFIDDLIW